MNGATPADWEGRMAPGLDVIEAIAIKAYDELPAECRALLSRGLFEGRGIGDLGSPVTGELPNRILLYRRPILDYWAEHEETLGSLVSHVLIHEIGHHFGLSDEDMEALEDSVA